MVLGFGSLAARRVDRTPAPTESHSRGKTQRVPGKQTYTKKISTNHCYEGDKKLGQDAFPESTAPSLHLGLSNAFKINFQSFNT